MSLRDSAESQKRKFDASGNAQSVSLQGEYFICLSISFWGFREGSREHIMKRLAMKNKVLYVDYPINPLHLFKFSHVRSYFLNRRRHLEKVNDNLFILRPYLQLPFGSLFCFINTINQFFLYLQIKRSIFVLNFKRPILWIYSPLCFPLLGRFDEKLSIYHCIDNFAAESSNNFRRRFITNAEERISRGVNIVFVVGQLLKRKLAVYTSKLYLLNPGLDDNYFKAARLMHIRYSKEIIMGFVGTIDKRFDADIVNLLARRHPEWKVLLVGPVMRWSKRLSELKRLRNVEFIGLQSGGLEDYYKRFNVGIIPYYVNEFTNCIIPIKIFEYFAFGIPVVITPLEALNELSGEQLFHTAAKENFVDAAEKIIYSGEHSILRQKRITFASNNLWSKKVEYIEKTLLADLNTNNPHE